MGKLEKNRKNKGAELELGKTYRFAGYDWTACEVDKERHFAVIQSHGVTHGAWPGYVMPQFGNGDYYTNSIDGEDISAYDKKMKELYDVIKDAESKSALYGKGLYLIPKEKVVFKKCCESGSDIYWQTLKVAAENYSSFGASCNYAWLGTACGSNNAWCVCSGSGVYYGSYQNFDYVIAPAFNLDLSKVEITGDEIVIKESDHTDQSEKQSDPIPYHSIWEYGLDITRDDGKTIHLDPGMIRQVSNALYESIGRRSVASYTKRPFTTEQYINVCHAIADYMESHSEIEYEILKNVLGVDFEKEENWVVKTMFTANQKSRTVEHPEKFSSGQEAWNRIKELVLADQNSNEVAEVRYDRDAYQATVVHADKTSCKFFAEKADIPETPSLDGNAGEKQEMAALEEGKTYRFAGYDWTACEIDNTGHYAVIQSHGVTHGAWPGYVMPQFGNGNYYGKSIDGQDISEYDDKMRALYDSIKEVETKSSFCIYGKGLFLISYGKAGFIMCANRYSKNYLKALKEVARKDAGVSQDSLVWLGTVYSNDPCYTECVSDVGECVDNQTNDYVIAPSFNIDLSKVDVVRDEIVIKA